MASRRHHEDVVGRGRTALSLAGLIGVSLSSSCASPPSTTMCADNLPMQVVEEAEDPVPEPLFWTRDNPPPEPPQPPPPYLEPHRPPPLSEFDIPSPPPMPDPINPQDEACADEKGPRIDL